MPSAPPILLISCLCALAALSSCGASGARPAIELPLVGTVGDLPPPEATLEVTVGRDGVIWCEGQVLNFDGFVARLHERALAAPSQKVSLCTISDLNLLLRLDRDLPYGALSTLLVACVRGWPDRWFGVGRIFFAVSSDSGEGDGALALFLPYDDGSRVPFEPLGWDVTLTSAGSPSDPAALYRPLVQHVAVLDELSLQEVAYVLVDPEGDVPLGAGLQAVDVAFRAGVRLVMLGSQSTAAQDQAFDDPAAAHDLTALVAATPRSAHAPHIRLDGSALGGGATPMPAVARVHGAFAGLPEVCRIEEEWPNEEFPEEDIEWAPVDRGR